MIKVIKKIRLKKDTPDHKAGELFVLMSNNGIYEIDAGEDDPAVFYGGDVKNFDEWFEEVADCKTFCDSVEKCVVASKASFMSAVSVRFPKGCQKQRDRFFSFIEAVRIVSQDEGFMRKNGGGFGWPVIEYKANNPGVDDIAERQHAGEFYFDTREHALASAMNHTREWQTILNYDWSRE